MKQDVFEQNLDDIFRAKREIESSMECLLAWAWDYEEGQPVVPDSVYDAQVRQLQRLKEKHPNDWLYALRRYPEFEDSSWTYTGSFIHGKVED